MMHFDTAMDEQMCEDVMSLMDDTQRKYGMYRTNSDRQRNIHNLFN